MKRSIRTLLALATLMGAIFGTAGVAGAANKATYYVSLGDSVAGEGNNKQYPNQLFNMVRGEFKQLQLVKLGCAGESTDSMITGVPPTCHASPQLDEALAVLEAHPGQIAFITITIGAGDVLGTDGVFCFDPDAGVFDLACVEGELPNIESNLDYIIETLQAAAPGVPILGMNYADPFIGYWVTRPDGHSLAYLDHVAVQALNAGLVSTYQSDGAIVADVTGPDYFNSDDFTDMVVTKEWGEIPVNVANVCAWTFFCSVGDVHPNTEGHGVIAAAFEAVMPT